MPQLDPALAQELAGQDAAREVAVKLAADTGEYNKQMESAAAATAGVADALIKVEQAFVKTFRVAGGTLVGVGGMMTGLAGTAATVASRFDDAFARVEKTTNLVGAELSAVNEEIREISTRVPVAVEELAHLADISGQLGVEADNLALYAETAAALGVATEISSHQAVVALSQLIGIFGHAEEEVEGLASSLAVLANQTRASEHDILNFSVRVGGVAQTVGATADEMMAVGAAVTGMGLEVEAAGTAIQTVLLDMQQAAQAGGDRLRAFADVMGITRDEFRELQQADPARAFHDLVQSLGAAEDQAGSLLRELDIREVRATQTMLALASASDELTEAMGMSSEAFREAEEVHELAEIRFDTLIQQLTVFRQSVSEIWRSIGQGLLPILQFFVERITDIVNVFNQLPQPVKTAIGVFMGLGGVLTTIAGTLAIIFGTWHGLILALAMGPRIIAAVTAASSRLATSMGATASTTGAAAAAMNSFTPAVHRALRAVQALTLGLVRRGAVWAIKEFGAALRTIGRFTLPGVTKGLGMLGLALGKVAAAVGIVWGLFEGGRWIWNQLTGDAREASDTLETLAESMDRTHEAAGGYTGELEKATESTKEFADANWELIRSLQALDDEDAMVGLAETIARNLVEGGATVSEAASEVEELLAEAGLGEDAISDLDMEARIDFDSNVDRVRADVERMSDVLDDVLRQADEESFWDEFFDFTAGHEIWTGQALLPDLTIIQRALGPLDDELEEAFAQIFEGFKYQAQDDFAGAVAFALDSRRAIDEVDAPAHVEEELIRQWEHHVSNAFDQLDDEFRGSVQEFLEIGQMEAVDFAELLLGDDTDFERYFRDAEPIREELREMGVDLENISEADLEPIAEALHRASIEAARTADETAEVEENMSRLEELFQEMGEPSDDQQARRFREHMLELQALEHGYDHVIDLLQEHIEQLEEAGDIYGDEWEFFTTQLEQYGREWARIELRDIESEVNARDAGDAVDYLTRQIRMLGNALDPATQQLRDDLMDLRERTIADIHRDLQRLLDERDRIQDRIESQEERHQRRMEDLSEDHQQRLEDLEEDHNDRLDDIRERRDERLADAEEQRAERLEDAHDQYLERLDDIKEREKQALEDYSREIALAFDPQERLHSQQFISGQAMLRNMEQQADRLEQFGEDLEQLQQMGLDWDTIEALGLDDPRQYGQVERLLQDAIADPSLIDSINNEWAERLEIGEGIADQTSHVVTEEFDEAREEAKESYEELQEDIREAHRDTVESITEDYEDAVADQKEAHADAVESAKEDYRERQEDMREDHERTVDDLTEQMEELARDSGDSLEELIERGFDSNIEGIERVAEELQTAVEQSTESIAASFDDLDDAIMDGWHSAISLDSPAGHPALGIGVGTRPQGEARSTSRERTTTEDDENWFMSAVRSFEDFMVEGFAKFGRVIPGASDNPDDYRTPGLAEGGVVTDETVARIGEGHSPEVVIPLDQRGVGFVSDVLDRISGDDLPGGQAQRQRGRFGDVWGDAQEASSRGISELWRRVDRITEEGLREHEREIEKLPDDVDDVFTLARAVGEDISEDTWAQVYRITEHGLDDVDDELHRLPVDMDDVMRLAKQRGERGSRRAVDGINEILKDGTREAAGIVAEYATEITDVVNPLLEVLGFDPVPSPTGSQAGASRTEVDHFALGGLVEGSGGTDSIPAMVSPFEYVIRPEAVTHYGVGLMDEINSMRFARGGLVNPDSMSNAQRFAMREEGKPYSWGAHGPDAYDCSGYWSAIVNVINQRHPYQRLFATSSFAGGEAPAGFLPGLGEVAVGVTQARGGTPGHMSGDLGPLSTEARSGDGVVTGPEARAATDPMFDRHFHLGDGVYMGPAGAGLGLPEIPELPFDVEGVGTTLMRHLQAKVVEWVWDNTYTSSTGLGSTEGVSDEQRAAIKAMARSMMPDWGWGDDQWPALEELVRRESSWNPTAANPDSSAFGLFQFLDSTWESYGGRTVDPRQQIVAGFDYIADRYGTPRAALEHWLARVPIDGVDHGHWYATGGVATGPSVVGVGERGREAIVPLESQQGMRALSEALSTAMAQVEPSKSETYFQVDRVVAHDPNKMARDLQRLESRKRMAGGV